ncbi:MAG: hypothetical protein KF773_30890 [Deltaproteobacteria bacterium]|nr:hypothetical protein [Deltaproteobacteria bacterium]MCW5809186.1 hypothetical protein [Deltaproteobacteria bacterium]
MTRIALPCVALLGMSACAVDEIVETVETSTTEQAGIQMQGIQMQGIQMQGIQMQGIQMQGFQLGNATIGSDTLAELRVEKGELVGRRNGSVVRGTALAGARLFAQGTDAQNQTVTVEYRITSVAASSAYDPSGATYLYAIEQLVDGASWQPACGADPEGSRLAIPMASTWDATGARHTDPGLFTFACTSGVIAKCYRWGYRPWLTGYGANMHDIHQTCTRMARADYCGTGVPGTRNGTAINVWDRLGAPGPIQKHGLLPPLGMLFEAGWNPDGAVCLSRVRWLVDDLLDGGALANLCPDRLVSIGLLGQTVCDTVGAVLGLDTRAYIFNESYLNLL